MSRIVTLRQWTLWLLCWAAGLGLSAVSQAQGSLEQLRVHSPSLEGNLQGNDAVRDVYVYLPPGYQSSGKRYPVLYFLHGYAVTADVYVEDVLGDDMQILGEDS